MTADNLLQYLTETLFVIIFLVVTVKASRQPRRANVDVALLFGVFSFLVVEGWVTSALHIKSGTILTAAVETLLLALPYLLLRLVDDFTVVPRLWMVLGVVGLAVSAGGFILLPLLALPTPVLHVLGFSVVAYFVVFTLYTALAFVRAARGTNGVTTRRMQAVGAGSLCLGLIIVLAGMRAIWPGLAAWWTVLGDLSTLGSGVCYFIGFAPPAWLRRTWQEPELHAFLGQATRLPHLPTMPAIVCALEQGAAASLGAPHASIGLWDDNDRVLRFYTVNGQLDPWTSHTTLGAAFTTDRAIFSDKVTGEYPFLAPHYQTNGTGALVAAPITAEERKLGVLAVYAGRSSIFAEDDLVLAELLADQAAVVLEGRALIDDVAQRTAQLEAVVTELEAQIVDRQRAEDALQRSNDDLARATQVKSEFLANMSHELRTPLNAIIGFSEVLQDCIFGPLNERQQRYVGNVLEGGRHLLHLVNDILDLSKVEAGRMDLHREDLDVYGLLAEAVQTLLPLAQQKKIALQVEESAAAVLVQVDRQRFLQVLYNLLSNALKFTPAGGDVRVSCTVLPCEVAVAVADTGIGIAPEDQARIFEEFAQVDSTLARSQQGTGLGLALTRRLVELSGGTLMLESAPGQGSTFTFTVPRTNEAPAEVGMLGDVLVVEDHPPTQELLRLYLSEAGYGVHIVHQMQEIVPRATELHPVAITLDLLLGDDVAWPMLRQLKVTAETKDIPVVIVSVLDDEQATGFALGAADYLVKPAARQELLHALRRAVGTQEPVRVLAVDDEPEALELIALALDSGPYTLLGATSGAEALALLAQQRPDVLIVDLMMAPMSGFDLIATLAAGELTSTIPIIVLTARDLTAEDVARLNGHVAAALPKTGLQKAHLLRELQRAIRSKQAGGVPHAVG